MHSRTITLSFRATEASQEVDCGKSPLKKPKHKHFSNKNINHNRQNLQLILLSEKIKQQRNWEITSTEHVFPRANTLLKAAKINHFATCPGMTESPVIKLTPSIPTEKGRLNQ